MKQKAYRCPLVLALIVLMVEPGCQMLDPSTESCDESVNPGEGERIGVLESTDGGLTWSSLGHACFHAPELTPVDPAPTMQNGRIVVYFFDIGVMRGQAAQNISYTMYRSASDDGLGFDEPTAAYSTSEGIITDPVVLQLPDETYRMYISAGSTVLSAVSTDGVSFTSEDGTRSEVGGVPGVLPLPDGRCRLFVCGAGGIISLVSSDGVNFTQEDGTRIASTGSILCDPHPIQLRSGQYLMTFKERPTGGEDPSNDKVYLARSDDGLTWVPENESVVTGSVPGIVETDDGRLLIYYVDFSS